MDVTDVDRIGTKTHALRPGGRRADDHVVRGEVEAFEGGGIKRREISEIARRSRQERQGRGPHASGGHEIAGRAPVEQRGIDRRPGIEVGHVPEHAFGAAALIEVVVNQRDIARSYVPAFCWRGKTSATM
jgi:hypothetical protein